MSARIAPIPCVVKNYALSLLTDIPWSTFVPGKFELFPCGVAFHHALSADHLNQVTKVIKQSQREGLQALHREF